MEQLHLILAPWLVGALCQATHTPPEKGSMLSSALIPKERVARVTLGQDISVCAFFQQTVLPE